MPRKRNTDPGVYPYPVEGGKRWGAVVSLPKDPRTGKRLQRRKQGFATKAEALAWRSAALLERKNLTDPDAAGKQSIDHWLDVWLDSLVDLAPNTKRSYRNNLVPVRPALGHIAIGALTPMQIQQFSVDRKVRGDSDAGIYFTHRIFKRAIRRAYMLGLIPTNPFDRVTAPKNPPHETTKWTLGDLHAFLRTNGDDPIWGDLWHVLCQTWMRVGEVTDLRWGDIDFRGNAIHITHAAARDDKLKLTSGPTKTKMSRRVIQIDDALTRRLKARRLRAVTSDMEDLVFPPIKGEGFMHGSAVSRALKRACVKAGVPELTTHEIRHNGGSLTYMAGIDVDTISARLGHSSTAVTYSVYIRTNAEHHARVARQIGTLFDPEFASDVTGDEANGQKLA